jgi:hypothetical protein
MMHVTVHKELLSSFSVESKNNDERFLSHLPFAYDTLIFCEVNLDHLHHLHRFFLSFELILCLKS